jgi:RNA polymerase sigma-70 factor (ECF subfamily)
MLANGALAEIAFKEAPVRSSAAESTQPPYPSDTQVDWQDLVARIHRGENGGMEELYRFFGSGMRLYMRRFLRPQELDDKIHDSFLIVVSAIRKGMVREPERLMGFVRTVARRQVAEHVHKLRECRREQLDLNEGVLVADARRNPEQNAAFQQRVQLMVRVLRELLVRDREILSRFYLDQQAQDEICGEMALSETQFRLLKSRAKSRFGALGKRKLLAKIH